MAAPLIDSAAPVSATQITRGSRTESRMEYAALSAGAGILLTDRHIIVIISAGGIRTLPAATHIAKVISDAARNISSVSGLKPSRALFIQAPYVP
jgi:hypothetical protein